MKPTAALMGWGQVRHTRHRPAHHAFAYPTAFLMLPMRSLQAGQCKTALAINRPAWFAFHDADHGDGRSAGQGGALAWLDELLLALWDALFLAQATDWSSRGVANLPAWETLELGRWWLRGQQVGQKPIFDGPYSGVGSKEEGG